MNEQAQAIIEKMNKQGYLSLYKNNDPQWDYIKRLMEQDGEEKADPKGQVVCPKCGSSEWVIPRESLGDVACIRCGVVVAEMATKPDPDAIDKETGFTPRQAATILDPKRVESILVDEWDAGYSAGETSDSTERMCKAISTLHRWHAQLAQVRK